MSELVNKVTCSTGKVVLLRQLKIKNQRLAAQSAARVSSDPNVMAIQMIEEIMKQLVVSIDGKKPSAVQLEDIDSIFTYSEYMELSQVLRQMMGDTQGNVPQVEMLNLGEQSLGSVATQV